MKIWAHTLVKNEERYLWFALMSVIDYVDQVMLWDTGSSDATLEIIEEIKKKYPQKIKFREVGEVDIHKFTEVRQEMLEQTKSDWFIIVDGDEVWWDESIKKLTEIIKSKGKRLDSIVSKYYNVVGDIFHYQEEAAGMYEIGGYKGHLNIRAVNRKIEGIHFSKPHGQQGIFNSENRPIQELGKARRMFIRERAYLHFTNMPRSNLLTKDREVPKRYKKFKHELGKSFPKDFYYPEVFFRQRAKVVPSPWIGRSFRYCALAALETPVKFVKRRLTFFKKSGY